MTPPPRGVLVIGYGNPLRGDDGLGPAAAVALAHQFPDQPDIRIMTVHQLTPDLAELLAAYAKVILLDAQIGERPGQLIVEEVDPAVQFSRSLSHYVSPGELLATTEALYGRRPSTVVAGLAASDFTFGQPLSEPVRQALPGLVAWVAELVSAAGRC